MNLVTSIPSYIHTECGTAFFYGVGAGALIRLTVVMLGWFRAAGRDTGPSE